MRKSKLGRTPSFCSRDCAGAAWVAEHRDQVLAAKARYNNTRKGKRTSTKWIAANRLRVRETKRRWKQRHAAATQAASRERGRRVYNKLRGAARVQRVSVIYARERSRKLLTKHVPKLCVLSAPHHGRIECHHKDGDVFNVTLANLEWRCVGHHQGNLPGSAHPRRLS